MPAIENLIELARTHWLRHFPGKATHLAHTGDFERTLRSAAQQTMEQIAVRSEVGHSIECAWRECRHILFPKPYSEPLTPLPELSDWLAANLQSETLAMSGGAGRMCSKPTCAKVRTYIERREPMPAFARGPAHEEAHEAASG